MLSQHAGKARSRNRGVKQITTAGSLLGDRVRRFVVGRASASQQDQKTRPSLPDCPTGKSVQAHAHRAARWGEKSRARTDEFCQRIQADSGRPVATRKINRFHNSTDNGFPVRIPPRPEGRMRNRHETRSGMRWTRRCARRARQCVRRNRVVLMPRRWHQVLERLTLLRGDGGKKARSPRRARYKP
jgi:hypothetical protein